MTTGNITLQIHRLRHGESRLCEATMPGLAEGQVRLRVERFAVTANTVTYATTGDVLGYWDFFPTGEPEWGCVPAMGWAEIVESRHPEVATGGRYYGWFPMARYVDMQVTPVAEGVRDDGPHRAAHAPVYRSYVATDRDAFYREGVDAEDRHALLRGLFITGWLAEDYFADNDWFGARRVVVLSASSKTAIGFAHCADARAGIEIIGVTSSRNHAFTHRLGCYDEVVTYDEITRLPAATPLVSIDMAGNGAVLAAVHAHLGDQLKHSMAVGRSHHEAPARTAALDRSETGLLLRTVAGEEARAGLGHTRLPGEGGRFARGFRRLEPRVADSQALARRGLCRRDVARGARGTRPARGGLRRLPVGSRLRPSLTAGARSASAEGGARDGLSPRPAGPSASRRRAPFVRSPGPSFVVRRTTDRGTQTLS